MTSTTTPTSGARRSAWASDPGLQELKLDLGRPVRAIEREARSLHDLEHVGESEWTPWIANLGLVLFFAPVIAVMTALTFAAYYLAS